MFQSGGKIKNNLIESQQPQRIILDFKRNEQSLQLLDQFLLAESPEKKFADPEQIDWDFISSKNSRVAPHIDLHQLAESLGRGISEAHFNGHSDSRLATEGTTEDSWPAISDRLPFYSKWFDPGAVHRLERQSLPEFFGEKPSKTLAFYLRARNFMFQSYWRKPGIYLTATACRRCISGDAPAVLRVHSFLETWGLINLFCVKKSPSGLSESEFNFPRFLTPANNPLKFGMDKTASHELAGLLKRQKDNKDLVPCICFQCQGQIGREWFALATFEKTEDKASTKICVCTDCFNKARYPVFFGPENWRFENLEQFYSSLTEKTSTLDEKLQILEGLGKNRTWSLLGKQNSKGRIVNEELKETQTKLLLIPLENKKENLYQHLRYTKTNKEDIGQILGENFEQRMREICESTIAGNNPIQNEDLTVKLAKKESSLRLLKEFGQVFVAKAEKITGKLKFFDEAEKIIHHEKQNLNLI